MEFFCLYCSYYIYVSHLLYVGMFVMYLNKEKTHYSPDAAQEIDKVTKIVEPRQTNLCLRAFRHDKF